MYSLINKISHDGKELTMKQWSKELGVPYMTLYGRFRKGLPIEDVLTRGELERGNPNFKK